MTFPKKTFAYVLWNDAHSPGSTTVVDASTDMLDVHGSVPILTAGWVLRHNDVGITLAAEFCGGNDYRGVTHIPASMIVEVAVTRPPRERKKPKPAPETSVPE
jgi:hypothetical protein